MFDNLAHVFASLANVFANLFARCSRGARELLDLVVVSCVFVWRWFGSGFPLSRVFFGVSKKQTPFCELNFLGLEEATPLLLTIALWCFGEASPI